MTAWRIHVVCSDPELDPFSFHEQLITVEGFPVVADVLAEHADHEIQAILVDRLGDDGAVRIRPPGDVHPVVWWRELASGSELVGHGSMAYPCTGEHGTDCPGFWDPARIAQAAAADPGAGTPGAG